MNSNEPRAREPHPEESDRSARANLPASEDGETGATSPNAVNATHTEDGKFAKGNRLGKGNPGNKRIQKLKHAVLAAVSPEDIRDVVKKLLGIAKDGKPGDATAAAKVLMDRLFGKEIVAKVESTAGGGFVLVLPANGTEVRAREPQSGA